MSCVPLKTSLTTPVSQGELTGYAHIAHARGEGRRETVMLVGEDVDDEAAAEAPPIPAKAPRPRSMLIKAKSMPPLASESVAPAPSAGLGTTTGGPSEPLRGRSVRPPAPLPSAASSTSVTLPEYASVGDWLESLGLGHLAQSFVDAGVCASSRVGALFGC